MKRLMMVTGVSIFTLAILSAAFGGEASKVRPSAWKGSWYAGTRETLASQVDTFLQSVPESAAGQDIVGLISPHAAYPYSGEVAAWGYKNLSESQFERVMVLGPTHYVSFEGVSIPRVAFYETPLGRVRVDTDSCEKLLSKPLFQSIHAAHQMEHAIEMQLPFLQRTLGEFPLIPIIVGRLEKEQYDIVTRELAALCDAGTLVIASSDFTHFGPRFGYVPFTQNLRENISKLDHGAIDFIVQKDWEGFLTYGEKTQTTICGFKPIALLLNLLPPDAQGRLLRYRLSGDMTDDYHNSVSYASIIFVRDDK